MAKHTRSVRLSVAHHRFIDQSSFEFGTEVRSFLTSEQVRYAAGICAGCGNIAYIGGHRVTGGGTPLGQHLGLRQDEEIDLCDACAEVCMNSLMNDETEAPVLEYREWWGDPFLYRADRDAIADAQPDDEWAVLVTTDTAFTDQDDRLRAILAWARATDLEHRYATDSIAPSELRRSLHTAVPDETELEF